MTVAKQIERRAILRAGGLGLLAAIVPSARPANPLWRSVGLCLVDPEIPDAGALAFTHFNPLRIVELLDDPFRVWHRERLASENVAGVTRWSDFVVLREVAHDERLRVRSERHLPNIGRSSVVAWEFY